MIVKSKVVVVTTYKKLSKARWASAAILLMFALNAGVSHAQQTQYLTDDAGYKLRGPNESEFDNESLDFVKDWRNAEPREEYDLSLIHI